MTSDRRCFLPLAARMHLPDVDAAAIRLAEPRAFAQQIATWLFHQSGPDDRPLAGVRFESRHGDDLRLCAVFERPEDVHVSGWLGNGAASAYGWVGRPALDDRARSRGRVPRASC